MVINTGVGMNRSNLRGYHPESLKDLAMQVSKFTLMLYMYCVGIYSNHIQFWNFTGWDPSECIDKIPLSVWPFQGKQLLTIKSDPTHKSWYDSKYIGGNHETVDGFLLDTNSSNSNQGFLLCLETLHRDLRTWSCYSTHFHLSDITDLNKRSRSLKRIWPGEDQQWLSIASCQGQKILLQ